jgi:hypothetical protein
MLATLTLVMYTLIKIIDGDFFMIFMLIYPLAEINKVTRKNQMITKV